MRFDRPTIAWLMFLMVGLAVGLAGLIRPSMLWASFYYSLTIGLILAAVTVGIVGEGRFRSAAVGFAIFGMGHLTLIFGPLSPSWFPPPILTSILVYHVTENMEVDDPTKFDFDAFKNSACSLLSIVAGLLGAALGWFSSRRRGNLSRPTTPHTDQP